MATAPCIPVEVSPRPEARILLCETRQSCINRLLFGSSKTNRRGSLLHSKHLGPQHRCIRDTDQTISMFSYVRLGVFFFQAEDGIRDLTVTGVQTCALPI